MTDTPITCVSDDAALPGTDPLARVVATSEALALIGELRQRYGPVMFHQSGGCCDGSSPMCYPEGEFRIGSSDVRLGAVDGADFYMSGPQFEAWKHTQLILDVVPGRGGMFSLDNGTGKRFLIRSRLFSDEERAVLEVEQGA
ncbi:MAG: DUF779 domain-containing protein [Pseudomonadota bacterium]